MYFVIFISLFIFTDSRRCPHSDNFATYYTNLYLFHSKNISEITAQHRLIIYLDSTLSDPQQTPFGNIYLFNGYYRLYNDIIQKYFKLNDFFALLQTERYIVSKHVFNTNEAILLHV